MKMNKKQIKLKIVMIYTINMLYLPHTEWIKFYAKMKNNSDRVCWISAYHFINLYSNNKINKKLYICLFIHYCSNISYIYLFLFVSIDELWPISLSFSSDAYSNKQKKKHIVIYISTTINEKKNKQTKWTWIKNKI